jgi:hypothetical protein
MRLCRFGPRGEAFESGLHDLQYLGRTDELRTVTES